MQYLLDAISEEFRGEIRRDEPMVSRTSWRIGGPAQLFLVPEDTDDLQALLTVLKRFRVPWMVLGNGSNLLVRDGGIAGAVISLERFDAIEMKILGRIEAGAGLPLAELIRQAVASGLQGLEELSGIPGTVGGALVMNAGAGATEIGTLVESLVLVDEEGKHEIDRDAAGFNYRCSDLADRGAVTSAIFKLQKTQTVELEELCREALQRRHKAQGVGGAHAGSVFRNPSQKKAWQLIEAAGLSGECCGHAEISRRHCNHIVNLGQATADDVLSLIEKARQRVHEQSGIDLELEVQVVGQGVAE